MLTGMRRLWWTRIPKIVIWPGGIDLVFMGLRHDVPGDWFIRREIIRNLPGWCAHCPGAFDMRADPSN